MARHDDDATINTARPAAPSRRGTWLLAIAAGLVLAGAGGWLLLRPPAWLRSTVQAPGAGIALADEGQILAARSRDMLAFRLREAPAIVVLSFPTLGRQGQALNRVGAFVDRAGLPHDRVLTDAELDAAIRQSGATPETYYFGHGYRLADMARFYAAADAAGVALNAAESTVRRLLEQEGLLRPGSDGAVITLPPETDAIDVRMRAAALRREAAAGIYVTDPAYAAYARAFWTGVLTEQQRAGLRAWLASQGYDTANEDLMANLTQANLVHTRDPRLFRPDLVGLPATAAADLRDAFIRGMPDGWLRRTARS